MKLFKLVLVITALALFIIACNNAANTNTANTNTGGTQPSPTASPTTKASPASTGADDLAAAREYYGDNCAICHKDDGSGGLVKIDNKRLKVPALTSGHALGHTEEQLAKQIAQGGDGMPPFKDKLKPEEINNLVRYVRKQFQSGATSATDKKPLPTVAVQ